MALVAYVFATVLMMCEGIRAALVATGQPDNVIGLRKGAGAEINSGITRAQAAVLETLPGLARDAGGAGAAQRHVARLAAAALGQAVVHHRLLADQRPAAGR